MVDENGSSPQLKSHTLGTVIDAARRRLDAVEPEDPAARLLREHLDDLTGQRDRAAEGENAARYETNVAAFVAGCAFVLVGLAGAGLGVYDLVTPGHSASTGVMAIGVSLLLALLGGFVGIVIRWAEIREHRAKRAARRG